MDVNTYLKEQNGSYLTPYAVHLRVFSSIMQQVKCMLKANIWSQFCKLIKFENDLYVPLFTKYVVEWWHFNFIHISSANIAQI